MKHLTEKDWTMRTLEKKQAKAFKKKQAKTLKNKWAGVRNVQTGDSIVECVIKSGFEKSMEVHCPLLEGHGCKSHD